jgi:hypothetical protein
MAITNPALVLAIEELFGLIRPTIINLKKLGTTDFSAGAPNVNVAPGATLKVPISSVAAAAEYHEDTNNYLTGGDTDWASLTCKHFLQGYDISGVDVDRGINAGRIKQLFSARAAAGISLAASGVTATALTDATASTAVTLPAAPTLEEYSGLYGDVERLNKVNCLGSVLAVSGSELGRIKAAFYSEGINPGGNTEMAAMLGFGDIAVVPGATGRLWVVPPSSVGFIARVPEIIARYAQAGAETDPESGLSIGIVVADDQAHNREVVNADLWFGCALLSANAEATKAGVIKVGTAEG